MTSNIGSHFILEDPDLSDKTKSAVMDILKASFRPEFLNRVDETIIFKGLDLISIKEIVRQLLKGVQDKLDEKHITLEFSEELVEYLAKNSYDPHYGARPLKRYIQKELETKLAKAILSNEIKDRDKAIIDISNGEVVIKK